MSAWAVIVAAGRGARSGLRENKVFYPIDGRSALGRCVDTFERCGLFDGIAVVISERDEASYRALSQREGFARAVSRVAFGGETRRESVYNGLCSLPADVDIVAIHDAARPFVTPCIIAATVDSAREYGSGVISTPVVDTIKQVSPEGRVTTLERSALRAVQTPQTFAYEKLMEAHRRASEEGFPATDDAAVFEHCFGAVRLVTTEGAEGNTKLTTRSDFAMLGKGELPDVRMGQGYDVHRLVHGRPLILCGVEVPHTMGLDGHSDADVATHALMDALLGAIGEGDIGRHFPDTDSAYKGISSLILLRRVAEILRGKGFRLLNADLTIVAQKPKLAACIPQMRCALAQALDIEEERINVKATTTEHLGFEGEEAGISAQAVALVARDRAL